MLARAEIKQLIRDVEEKLSQLEAPGDDSPPGSRWACERMIDALTRALLGEPVDPLEIDALIQVAEHAARWRRETYGIDRHAGRRLYWNDVLARMSDEKKDAKSDQTVDGPATCRQSGGLPDRDTGATVTGPMAVTEREDHHPGPPPRRLTLEDLRTLRGAGSLDDLSPERQAEIEANLNAEFERERDEWIRRTLGARLRIARERAALTQAQAAEIAGGKTRRNEINRWENAHSADDRLPRYETRNRLADGLGVPRAHFIPELEVDG